MKKKYKTIGKHQAIMMMKLGRPLEKGEEVHHKDHNPNNNDPDNLELMPSKHYHLYHHHQSKDKHHDIKKSDNESLIRIENEGDILYF